MSILSSRADGFGFFYGYAKPDMRQINVRCEVTTYGYCWAVYVGGDLIGDDPTKAEAEARALAWLKAHPRSDNDNEG